MSHVCDAAEPRVTRARRVMPVARLDGRTRYARRVAELQRIFVAALGGQDAISPALAGVTEAAWRKVTAEEARAAYLNDRSIGLGHLIRAERSADKAIALLGIKHSVPPPQPVGLAAHEDNRPPSASSLALVRAYCRRNSQWLTLRRIRKPS